MSGRGFGPGGRFDVLVGFDLSLQKKKKARQRVRMKLQAQNSIVDCEMIKFSLIGL